MSDRIHLCTSCGAVLAEGHVCKPITGDQMPPDPFSVMQADASALHEMFRSYVEAGFSEDQAMQFVTNSHKILLQVKLGMMLAQGANPFMGGGE